MLADRPVPAESAAWLASFINVHLLPDCKYLQSRRRNLALAAAVIGWLLSLLVSQTTAAQTFVHPGGLHVQADFDRMAAKVAVGAHPWIDSYNKLITYSQAQTNWTPAPVLTIYRCSSGCTNNFARSQQDALAIYYLALRYRITGDANYANKAIAIMDAWSGTCTNVSGDSNFALGAGLCGYEFATAGEALRGYSGWSVASQTAYSNFLFTVFYAASHDFLTRHNNTCGTHYRCNWDCCNMASMIAIGVFCDNPDIFNEAVAYYTNGVGNGMIERAVGFIHPNGLGQTEEAGRDQAHNIDGFNWLSVLCQVAWNQGVDLYGYDDNRYLRGLEYVAKYNLGNGVPYVHHRDCDMTYDEMVVSSASRGGVQYFWEVPYAHYVNQLGMAAPYTAQMAALLRPDGGISNWNSPDWFGFTSLTFYRDPIAAAATPSGLIGCVDGPQVTLSWWGSAYATSYNVKRATNSGGPYTTVAVTGPNNACYVDSGQAPGITNYYVVSANNPDGESTNSVELAAAANDLVTGNIIGSPGSYNNSGATGVNAFDGSFESFYDATNTSGDWTGLDLGAGVNCVVTRVEYAPRPSYANRMVGGVFQGANDPNFTNPVTLHAVATAPTDGFVTAQSGILTSASINNATGFRYLRYLGPAGGSCNVGEIRFHGTTSGLQAPPAPTNVTATILSASQVNINWSTCGTATSYNVKRAASADGPYLIAANTPDIYVNDILPPGSTNCYYRVSAVNSVGESADSSQAIFSVPGKFTGTIIGTPGSYNNSGNTISNVFDGDLTTYFDGPNGSNGSNCWAGLDLGGGAPKVITLIQYCPRAGYASRMINGLFQGATDSGFMAPVTLFTVNAQPPDGILTGQAINNTNPFRFVRYLSPVGGWGNVAEVQFYGFSAVSLTPPVMTVSVSNGSVWLAWPPDHTGWRLVTQTNTPGTGLGTNWNTVVNSSSTNQIAIPLDNADASAFFRLIYP